MNLIFHVLSIEIEFYFDRKWQRGSHTSQGYLFDPNNFQL